MLFLTLFEQHLIYDIDYKVIRIDDLMTKKEFDILRCICESTGSLTQRIISENTGNSLGTVNSIIANLYGQGYIDKSYNMTEEGLKALEPYKVTNAIILAAGMSTRFVPFSYEKPKGLTIVKGEVLIERQIKQLKEAGINDIILVLGHMLEKFLYLKDKYDVKVVINNEYRYKNTHSSVYYAREYLDNTYICCADNYFPENLFHKYNYRSSYSAIYMPGTTYGERGVNVDDDDLIVYTQKPAVDQWVVNGYAYFNREFSAKYKKILEEVFDLPQTSSLYWEQVYAEHVDELKLYIDKYPLEKVVEFDSVQELEAFDPDYIKYNALPMTGNICKVFDCSIDDIHEIKPISKGLTNKSFYFECCGEKYIYRNPGQNSNEFIDRHLEKKALEIAKELGIDDSYIYEDENEGWKISHFIEATESFDFKNEKHLSMLGQTLRTLFKDPIHCGKEFDYYVEAEKIISKIKEIDQETYLTIQPYDDSISAINRQLKKDAWPVQLAHNDIYEDNLIVAKDKLYLIDWEYAGDTDIGFDICKLFVKPRDSKEKIDYYLEYYFGRKPTKEEHDHIVGCAAVCYFYWYVWALYMIKNGNDYTSYMMDYYNMMNEYSIEYNKSI